MTASVLVLVMLGLAGCKRDGGPGGSFLLASGDVGDTTVHFGRLDTTLLTNGSGWVRKEPGVMPPDMNAPPQLQAPSAPDSAFTPLDSGAPPASRDSGIAPGRPRRDTVLDTLAPEPMPQRMPSHPRRDSVPPPPTRPDTGGADSTR